MGAEVIAMLVLFMQINKIEAHNPEIAVVFVLHPLKHKHWIKSGTQG